jgi:hypothetical protein
VFTTSNVKAVCCCPRKRNSLQVVILSASPKENKMPSNQLKNERGSLGKGTGKLKDLGEDGKIILKWIFKI